MESNMNQSTIAKMSPIQKITFDRAIVLLDSMKCVYAIMDPFGNKHGTLPISGIKRIKRIPKHPHGQRSGHVLKYVDGMKVGDVVQIPFDKFGGFDIQKSVASTTWRLWGKGSATSTIIKVNQVVEVMRII
jgi:hypothetical protein